MGLFAIARTISPRVVRDPVHVRKLLTREPGDPVFDLGKRAPWSALRIPREYDSDERRREVGQADTS